MAKLREDMGAPLQNLQRATGDQLGYAVQYAANVLAGVCISFIYGWQLALVALAVSGWPSPTPNHCFC